MAIILGITIENALDWIRDGAQKVIVTSWIFPNATLDISRLEALSNDVGKDRLVIDLSCKTVVVNERKEWVVAMNGWRTLTDTKLNQSTIDLVSSYCSELLVHAADVEGLCQGIDSDLVRALGEWCSTPCIYAGGAKDARDLQLVHDLS